MTARPLAAALAATIALALAGCGDDPETGTDSTPSTTSTSSSTVSSSTTSNTTAPTSTTSTSPAPPTTTTSTSTPPTQTTTSEDSEENDLPPAPGSPEEAFEEACQANPKACG